MMKAIRVHEHGGPEVLQYEELPDPQCQNDDVLIKVNAVGVNPVDTYIRAGTQGYSAHLPYTPGFDAAGIVEAVGKDVARAQVGERVYCAGSISGTYAEKVLCNENQVFPLPENMTFSQGAALGVPYATAYQALFHIACAKPGEWVLIHGASGGVGLAAVQMALSAGMRVIGTAGSDEAVEMLKKEGLQFVLDHYSEDHFQRAVQYTDGHGIDVILEMLSNANLGNDLPIMAKKGRIVVIGCRGNVEINPRLMMIKDLAILGMTLLNATEEEKESIHHYLIAGMKKGVIYPIIGKEIPLSEAAKAHDDVINAKAYGKIVLLP